MTVARHIADVMDYGTLVDAFRARQRELGLTVDTIDRLGGFTPGHTGKLLGEAHVKKFGWLTLWLMMEVLGLKLIMVEDLAAVARMEGRWERRTRPLRDDAHAISMALMERVKPAINKQIGARLSEHRKKIPPAKRSSIARRAARARWRQSATARAQRVKVTKKEGRAPGTSPKAKRPAGARRRPPRPFGTAAGIGQAPQPLPCSPV